jgi:hypothetical protein
MGTPDGLQDSPSGAPGYPGSQYGAVPGQSDAGMGQQMWDYDRSPKAQPGSSQLVGQPMPGQQQMYMSHRPPGNVPSPPGHHGPPGPGSHYQGPPGIPSMMQQMGMPPPGHMGAGMMPGGGPNPHHGPPPPGHSMPPYQQQQQQQSLQQMHGPGPQQGMPANNGGAPVYYM